MLEFLRNLFLKRQPPRTYTDRLHGPGTFVVEVVIPSQCVHNMDLIWQASSHEWEHHKSMEADYWERTSDVHLVSDTDNPQDRCAVRVELAGRNVGHLSRGDALRLHRRLTQLGYDQLHSACKAAISGRTGYWTIHLDFVKELIYQPTQEQESAQ